jgi:hypothetical protein
MGNSTPTAEGINSSEIDRIYERFYSEDLYPAIHNLIIIRNGKLIAEAYCRDKNERYIMFPLKLPKFKKAGFEDYLRKPVKMARLIELANQAFEKLEQLEKV